MGNLRSVLTIAAAISLAAGVVAGSPVFTGPFPGTVNMKFLSQITPDELGAEPLPGVSTRGMLSDLWGWTSPSGQEYALVTNSGGIAFVRVTDPENPEFLGRIGSQLPFARTNIWGDPATFGNYAYFVTENDGSAIVVVDLTVLDTLSVAPSADTAIGLPTTLFRGGGYNGAHNIVINEHSGYAYVAGVHLQPGAANNACGAEQPARFNTLILDLRANPANPTAVACLEDVGEQNFHAVNYSGPDLDHQGNEILFVFDGRDREGQAAGNPVAGQTLIMDVSDKSNIREIARFRIEGLVISHNGWTTNEQDFLFIGDEVDELLWTESGEIETVAQPEDDPAHKPRTGTYIVDVSDLDNPVFVERHVGDSASVDRNFMVNGDKLYIASYTSGTRVLEITRDESGTVGLAPFASMATEPRLPSKLPNKLPSNLPNIGQESRFGTSFNGQWGIYARFDSGTIIASDINNGLFVTRLSDTPCTGIACSR